MPTRPRRIRVAAQSEVRANHPHERSPLLPPTLFVVPVHLYGTKV
jgi:hypothetical protein